LFNAAVAMKTICPLILALVCLCSARAQDGFFILAKAPLEITRDDTARLDLSFTNTGDKVLHRIRITSQHGIQRRSVVIIESLGPRQTVHYDIAKSILPGTAYNAVVVTCANYSVPIRLEPILAPAVSKD
jgi:hypothetical protein